MKNDKELFEDKVKAYWKNSPKSIRDVHHSLNFCYAKGMIEMFTECNPNVKGAKYRDYILLMCEEELDDYHFDFINNDYYEDESEVEELTEVDETKFAEFEYYDNHDGFYIKPSVNLADFLAVYVPTIKGDMMTYHLNAKLTSSENGGTRFWWCKTQSDKNDNTL